MKMNELEFISGADIMAWHLRRKTGQRVPLCGAPPGAVVKVPVNGHYLSTNTCGQCKDILRMGLEP